MSKAEKELLYEIDNWHIKDFNNRMEDNWSSLNYKIDEECHQMIQQLEKKYTDTYGDLPNWEYIDDVWKAARKLKEELNG